MTQEITDDETTDETPGTRTSITLRKGDIGGYCLEEGQSLTAAVAEFTDELGEYLGYRFSCEAAVESSRPPGGDWHIGIELDRPVAEQRVHFAAHKLRNGWLEGTWP